MDFLLTVASLAFLLAVSHPGIAIGQSDTRSSVAVGTFVGRDSLDARKEAASTSRTRSDLRGSATWTIELDSLDLRQKFTLRFKIPEPSPVTIVLRSLDSLPPRPGQYTAMLTSTGASHSRPGALHGDVYTRERDRDRHYHIFGSRVLITSVTMADGRPIVTGNVEIRGERYADAPPKTLVFDYVQLDIRGEFAARAAPNTRPQVVVTSQMQESVLRRALDGFVITHSGAINGDGGADSTRQSEPARQFLASRWRDAAIIERAQATGMQYQVRLRGRHAPVVCDVESTTEEIDCVTLPAPVVAVAGATPGTVAGRLSIRVPSGTLTTGSARIVHLLPNPVPLRQAFHAWCEERDKRDSIAEQVFTAKLESIKDAAAQTAALEEFVSMEVQSYRKAFHSFVTSYSVQHVATGATGQYAFSGITPGNYLLFATLPDKQNAYDWYVPITIHGGEHIRRDLDGSTMNTQGSACGMSLPFPAIHERDR
jgi:hypothetical protein